MSLRTFPDRVRHAVLFEAFGLAIFVPVAAVLFNQPMGHMGVVGIVSATIATLWNFVYNLGFDHAMLRFIGHTRKSLKARIVHVLLFEGGLLAMLIPPIAWYLGITVWQALMMDMAIVGFYLVYTFAYNLAYDRVFPVPQAMRAQPA
jgi:uncharacterized membrane protein